jgi:hypothetical protein
VQGPVFGQRRRYERDASSGILQALDVGLGLVERDVIQGNHPDVELQPVCVFSDRTQPAAGHAGPADPCHVSEGREIWVSASVMEVQVMFF